MKSNFHIKWIKDADMEFLPKTNKDGHLAEDKTATKQSFIQIGGMGAETTPKEKFEEVKLKM